MLSWTTCCSRASLLTILVLLQNSQCHEKKKRSMSIANSFYPSCSATWEIFSKFLRNPISWHQFVPFHPQYCVFVPEVIKLSILQEGYHGEASTHGQWYHLTIMLWCASPSEARCENSIESYLSEIWQFAVGCGSSQHPSQTKHHLLSFPCEDKSSFRLWTAARPMQRFSLHTT